MSTELLDLSPRTIVKTDRKRIRLGNGLLQIITRDELRDQIRDFGRFINDEYSGKELTLVPVLHGGAFFYVDLTKYLDEKCARAIDRAIVAQSYGDGTAAGKVKVYDDWIAERHIKDRHVLVIDDIFDSGGTAREVFRSLTRFQPASLELVCLLSKERERSVSIRPKYCLFEIDDCWVVGFGLDGDGGKYRHLRYIAELPKPPQSR